MYMNQEHPKMDLEEKQQQQQQQNKTSYKLLKNKITQYIHNNINLIFYIAAISTIGGGILHLLMLGPSSKPINFPMHLLPYTDALFTIAGISQIFWCIPMIKRWGINCYYVGLIGTIGLSLLLLITRIPNGITNLPLEDKNPMALLTEITQFLFIASTIIIIKYQYQTGNIKSIGNLFTSIKNIYKHDVNQSINSIESTNTFLLKTKYGFSNGIDNNDNLEIQDSQKLNNQINSTNTNFIESKSLSNKGIRLRKLGKYDEAIKYFEQSIKINPANVNAWYNMGVCLNRIGKKQDAITIYNKARELCYT